MDDERPDMLLLRNSNGDKPPGTAKEGLELKSFKSVLTWVCLDQSNLWRASLSWSIFFLLAIAVPIVNHFVYADCQTCDSHHRRPYDIVVQLSLFSVSALSFLSLSSFAHIYGIRRFLFLDKLGRASENVRQGYAEQLQRSAKILAIFVLPIFVADSVYKIWWFVSGGRNIPFFGNVYVCNIIACSLQLCSWLYRTAIFFVACVLFRLICYLQILKLQDFARVFEKESNVETILMEHLKIRRNLRIISHRFRIFILLTIVFVTMSQFASLLVTTKYSSTVNIYTAGEIALSSITLVTGLFICLRSATKITHRAQSITSLATKWHVCATIQSFDDFDANTPATSSHVLHTNANANANWDSDNEHEEEDHDDDNIDNTDMMPIIVNSISYQKRQALVTYFEHNKAGITVFGHVNLCVLEGRHVPKFGSWDNDNNVPYTAYFENARKEKTGKMINPNDPEENPEAFGSYRPNKSVEEENRYVGVVKQRNIKRNNSRNPVKKYEHQRSIESGNFFLSSPETERYRSAGNPYDDHSYKSAASVPKFGAWNEMDPNSGEGFTTIFNQVKEDKKVAASRHAPRPTSISTPPHPAFNGRHNSTTTTTKSNILSCCLFPKANGSH